MNGVRLYHGGSFSNQKLTTTSTGVSVTGDLVTSGNIDLADSSGGSNNRIKLGTGDDLQVYHDGSNGYVYNSGSGNLTLVGNGSNKIQIRAKNGENSITCNSDGSVELYYDNSRKLETFNSGVQLDDNLVIKDSKKAFFGDSYDLQIYHDGTDNIILSNGASCDLLTYVANGELAVKAVANGAVELYYNNAKTFETISGGATVTGQLYVTAEINLMNGSTNASRYIDAGLGDGNTLFLRGCSGGDANHETLAQFTRHGAVSLFHDAVKKFETTSDGVKISGTLTVDGEPFIRNKNAITATVTLTTAHNHMSVGPITINSGVTVTVASGATWTVL